MSCTVISLGTKLSQLVGLQDFIIDQHPPVFNAIGRPIALNTNGCWSAMKTKDGWDLIIARVAKIGEVCPIALNTGGSWSAMKSMDHAIWSSIEKRIYHLFETMQESKCLHC